MAPIIEIEKLGHVYNPGSNREVVALRDINLAVDRGDFVSIIGANGSGKSTLVRHLNALLLPTTGAVHVDGLDTRDPQLQWQVRQKVGMVFQNPENQMVGTTVEEDVAFGPENLGLAPAQIAERITVGLAAVDMTDFRQRPPHQLSGGQRQRVAIAGILAMAPRVMVLDEPTAMLDPRGRAEVMATLRQVNESAGITILFTTHFMDEAALTNRVIFMAAGQVLLDDGPAQVFSDPGRLAAAGLEVPPIAALASRLRQQGHRLAADLLALDELVDALCQLSSKV